MERRLHHDRDDDKRKEEQPNRVALDAGEVGAEAARHAAALVKNRDVAAGREASIISSVVAAPANDETPLPDARLAPRLGEILSALQRACRLRRRLLLQLTFSKAAANASSSASEMPSPIDTRFVCLTSTALPS